LGAHADLGEIQSLGQRPPGAVPGGEGVCVGAAVGGVGALVAVGVIVPPPPPPPGSKAALSLISCCCWTRIIPAPRPPTNTNSPNIVATNFLPPNFFLGGGVPDIEPEISKVGAAPPISPTGGVSGRAGSTIGGAGGNSELSMAVDGGGSAAAPRLPNELTGPGAVGSAGF